MGISFLLLTFFFKPTLKNSLGSLSVKPMVVHTVSGFLGCKKKAKLGLVRC